jgi:hypothetical protein
MDETEKAIRENFPGPNNAGLRAEIRRVAADGDPGAVRLLAGVFALTESGRLGLRAVADTMTTRRDAKEATR